MTYADAVRICRAAGMSMSDIRHAQVLAALPSEAMPLISKAAVDASDRAEKAMARRMLRAKPWDG
jgi:hypothetical protein